MGTPVANPRTEDLYGLRSASAASMSRFPTSSSSYQTPPTSSIMPNVLQVRFQMLLSISDPNLEKNLDLKKFDHLS